MVDGQTMTSLTLPSGLLVVRIILQPTSVMGSISSTGRLGPVRLTSPPTVLPKSSHFCLHRMMGEIASTPTVARQGRTLVIEVPCGEGSTSLSVDGGSRTLVKLTNSILP